MNPAAELDHTRVTVAIGPLVGPVLACLIAVHAARANLPVDRVSDSILLADALSARTPAQVRDSRVSITMQAAEGHLEIRVGPLRPGGGELLLADAAAPVGSRVIERLADAVQVRETTGGDEVIVLHIGSGA